MSQKILIIDDNLDTLQLVGINLESQGYEIFAAKDGEQGLSLAQKELPDLIFLDIMMPKIDGYEVARRLRGDPKTSQIPIIMFTAKDHVEDKVEGLEAGANDYLTKPTHPSELVARVKALLKRPPTSALGLTSELAASISKEIIGIIAPKGGLGITNLAINLGLALYEKTGEPVVVAETQPGRGDMSIYLGYSSSSVLTDLLERDAKDLNRAQVEKALTTHPTGVQFLFASLEASDARLNTADEQLEAVVKHLAQIAPYIILDLGSSLSNSAQKVLKHCDQVLVALESTTYTIQLAKALMDSLIAIGISRQKIHPILLNRARMEQAVSLDTVKKDLGYAIKSIFTPAPELAYQATAAVKPMIVIDPDSLVKQQTIRLAELILGAQ